jgi:acyl-CoA synthetase (AMP-forming)/AMP-acid ligase II
VLQDEPDLTWLRTGDLGFIDGGELFICGRLKDVIIVAGRNIYPYDIESRVVELSPLLDGSSVVAVGVDTAGSQAVAVICEVPGKPPAPAVCEGLARLIRGTIAAELGVPVARVVLASKGSVSRTTSGKLQRRETQRQLDEGRIEAIWDDQAQPLEKAA